MVIGGIGAQDRDGIEVLAAIRTIDATAVSSSQSLAMTGILPRLTMRRCRARLPRRWAIRRAI
jgi:hypothetical protein